MGRFLGLENSGYLGSTEVVAHEKEEIMGNEVKVLRREAERASRHGSRAVRAAARTALDLLCQAEQAWQGGKTKRAEAQVAAAARWLAEAERHRQQGFRSGPRPDRTLGSRVWVSCDTQTLEVLDSLGF